MSIRAHTLALAFASLVVAVPLAARAADTMQQPLPGQPGADTTVGQELRGAPYTVMITGACCIAGAIWYGFQLQKIRAVMRPIYQEMGLLPVKQIDPIVDEVEPAISVPIERKAIQ